MKCDEGQDNAVVFLTYPEQGEEEGPAQLQGALELS